MRTLTILRRKRFVACLRADRVYIEDHNSSDTVINGTPCRKIGTLKNGEEKSFEITDARQRVYVVSDALAKKISNDYYEIPEGSDNVYLSGVRSYNPATGSAFRFDNNYNEDAIRNRSRGTRIGVAVLIVATIVGFIIGLLIGNRPPVAEEFVRGEVSITLMSDFSEFETEGHYATFSNGDISVFIVGFYKEELIDGLTFDEFAKAMAENDEYDASSLKTEGELLYFYYDADNDDGEANRYYSYLYETDDTFWVVQFVCDVSEADVDKSVIADYAKTVKFS